MPAWQRSAFIRYAVAVGIVLLAAIVRVMIDPVLGPRAPFMTFVLPILFTALWCGPGPAILATTDHSILAAPYHRNSEANKAAFDILLGVDALVQRTLAQKKIDYIAICPGGPERLNYERAAPDGLVARLSKGQVPGYLEAVAGDAAEPMKVFRVRR